MVSFNHIKKEKRDITLGEENANKCSLCQIVSACSLTTVKAEIWDAHILHSFSPMNYTPK